MKTVADHAMGDWLMKFFPSHGNFDWDDGNSHKNTKHGVTWEDVESIFFNDFVFEGRIVEPAHPEYRFILLGMDNKKRKLALIFTVRKQKLRPISCRAMRRKERERYEEKTST